MISKLNEVKLSVYASVVRVARRYTCESFGMLTISHIQLLHSLPARCILHELRQSSPKSLVLLPLRHLLTLAYSVCRRLLQICSCSSCWQLPMPLARSSGNSSRLASTVFGSMLGKRLTSTHPLLTCSNVLCPCRSAQQQALRQ